MILHVLGPIWTILVLVQASGTLGALEPCEVDCSHYGSALGNFADDPFHCNMYYLCFSGYEWSDYPFTCPDGEMFDTVTKQCMADSYVCSEVCQKCSYSCSNSIIGHASNFSSCNSYIKCDGGDGTLAQCPEDNPYFDGNMCQKDVNKCCTCRPECSESDAENHVHLPDYSNCTNFYLCVAEGVPDQTSHGHCPSGNFNPNTGSCDDGTTCLFTCTNDIPDSGCDDDFICPAEGFFPRCTGICDPTYYYCTAENIGSSPQVIHCSNDLVVDPIIMVCIPPADCPV